MQLYINYIVFGADLKQGNERHSAYLMVSWELHCIMALVQKIIQYETKTEDLEE